jgi:hypothetical protein
MTPTRVLLFAFAHSEEQPVAEFRWSPESGVALVVHDPAWARLAREYFTRGIPLPDEERVVPAADGEAFMSALLRQSEMTYYGFVDASDQPVPEEPAGGGYGTVDAYRILAGLPPLSEPDRPSGTG